MYYNYYSHKIWRNEWRCDFAIDLIELKLIGRV